MTKRAAKLDAAAIAVIEKAARKAKTDRQRMAAAFAALSKLGYETRTRGVGTDPKDVWEDLDEPERYALWTGEDDAAFDAKNTLRGPLYVMFRGDRALLRRALKAAGMTMKGDHVLPAAKPATGSVKASEIVVGDVIDVDFEGRAARGEVIAINPYGKGELRMNLQLGSGFIARVFEAKAKVTLVRRGPARRG